MPGGQCTRSLACKCVVKHTSVVTTGPPDSPGIPARNGFTAYFVLSPATNSSCHRRPRIRVLSARSGRLASANLTPATGARTTRLRSPLKRRSSACHSSAHGPHDPPCHPLTSPDALASTASRPALVTTRDRPSDRNETVMDIRVIWVSRERKYFLKWGWTRGSRKRASDLP